MGGRGQFRVQSDDGWASMGGYMAAKVRKLDQQFEEQKGKEETVSSLFENVAIHVNGYTSPTADQLKSLMAQHGGRYHAYYSSTSTTHVIASNLPRAKAKDLRPNQKVVKPEWIVDSIKANSILPIQPYIVAAHGVDKNQRTISGFSSTSANSNTEVDVPCCSKDVTSDRNSKSEEPSLNQSKSSGKIPATTDNNFLSDFYKHSRLHFLSTWKTELADFVRSLVNNPLELSGLQKLEQLSKNSKACSYSLASNERCIMHVDMDCFFVSVGLISRPHLIGQPVAVTHHSADTPSTAKQRPGTDPEFERNYYKKKIKRPSTDNEETSSNDVSSVAKSSTSDTVPSFSEIASCNYEARSAGLKNGMFYGKAKDLCPDLIAIPYDFEAYREASRKLYGILCSYTRTLEAVSCDEALLDVTQLILQTGVEPSTVAEHIRQRVKEETGCNASAGIGPNIALARMATRVGKPNGQHQVTESEAAEFIKDHPVKDLPGVGYATASRLVELGAATCGELQKISVDVLKKEFGNKTGQKLYDLCRGVDKREVVQSKERKSVSADVNYGIRLTTIDEVKTFLKNLSAEVSDRLNKAHVTGKKVTLKVMVRRPDAPLETAKFGGHGVCHTMTRSKNLDKFTVDCDVIAKEAISLMTSLKVNVSDLRGIGIQMTQLKSDFEIGERRKSTMEKFVKSRPSVQPSTTPAVDVESVTAESTAQEIKELDQSSTRVEENKQSDFSTSFLDALPDDIRREVEQDLQAQKAALERTQNQMTSSVHSESASSMTSQNTATSKTNRSSSRGRGRKRSTAPKKSSKVKKTSSAGGSPNKLITEMFKVVGKSRLDEKPVKIDLTTSQSSNDDVGDKVQVTRKLQPEFEELPVDDRPRSPSPPSLGGATTTSGSRDAVRRWVAECAGASPMQDDIDEIVTFLQLLVVESHNLECVSLVLRTLRRCIMSSVSREGGIITSWVKAYDFIVEKVQEEVRRLYDDITLYVVPIT
uniref:DNA repair protein REV1 n=1 Tax=Phallusia mammillata TaxID=59560 RepID=A0A6F9DRA3_9ASCI|nr:DNA repair protein REV1-like [Phallusia mammillata]